MFRHPPPQSFFKLHRDGYQKFELKDKRFLKKIQYKFIKSLNKFNINKENITKLYSKIFINLKDHHKIQSDFQKYILKKKIYFKLIHYYKNYFTKIIDQNISVTNQVNFRVVRPFNGLDNIGFHRDTDLGHTPFELNVWIPLFDTVKKNSLCILPKSHLKKLDFFKFKKLKTAVKRGGKENKMGFLYKSFKFKNLNQNLMKPITVNFGEILIFYSSCMHGTTSNTSKLTRFSFDFNISNSFFPITKKHHGNEEKYQEVIQSQFVKNANKI